LLDRPEVLDDLVATVVDRHYNRQDRPSADLCTSG
jgi:hypothetical protein